MNRFGLEFHHFGLAVPQPDKALKLLTALGYHVGLAVSDPMQMVRLTMCHHPQMPDVEIICPSDVVSPIDRLLRRNGSLVYHLCYATRRIDAALTALEREGLNIVMISGPKPAVLFGGRDVAFYSVDGFGLIELLQEQDSPSTTS
jgi:hypothetical protein